MLCGEDTLRDDTVYCENKESSTSDGYIGEEVDRKKDREKVSRCEEGEMSD